MANPSIVLEAINESHLSASTTAQKYPLGAIYTGSNVGVDEDIKTWVYIQAVSALTKGGIYRIGYNANATASAYVPATTDANCRYGVAMADIANGSYGFLQVYGSVSVSTAGTATAGNVVRATAGAATVTDQSTTTADGFTVGVCSTGVTGAGTATVFLLNNLIATNGSMMNITADWSFVQSGTSLILYYKGAATSNVWTAE